MKFNITEFVIKLIPTAIVAGILAFVVGIVLSMLGTSVTGVIGTIVALVIVGATIFIKRKRRHKLFGF